MDENLLAEAKLFAARSGRTLRAVIEDAVRQHLASSRGSRERPAVTFPTYGSSGLAQGVDLDSSAELLDRLEGR